ncbi:unnamed protein product [Paramecium pentaurelia]|uniref:Uncharacterized protein n=1 Tax=Paramecium pentaurelia TaxID=43138 RepID=A0A8S1SNY5_9CILI|nr:unnamed protein product [Paramecium pentaurelia]
MLNSARNKTPQAQTTIYGVQYKLALVPFLSQQWEQNRLITAPYANLTLLETSRAIRS